VIKPLLLSNCELVNEGNRSECILIIEQPFIKEVIINPSSDDLVNLKNTGEYNVIDLEGRTVIPGIIDDQVHLREPGLTNKADIYHESKAAIAGGVTSFMDMPNTIPNAVTQGILEEKYEIARNKSLANYSFYIGATNDNLNDLSNIDYSKVCGIKVFMGASTGNMLVDNRTSLNNIFKLKDVLIAVHCEDEQTIKKNTEYYKSLYGNKIPIKFHSDIRSEESCYKSSSFAVSLAKEHNTKLHVLHLTTAKELSLFDNQLDLKDKKITAEVCVHHLWFDEKDYIPLQGLIKCNPSIKKETDKRALLEGLNNNSIDIIATDHAPHTFQEKQSDYLNCPSGLPSIQFSLLLMLEYYKQNKISIEKIVEKMCHNPSILFKIDRRGFIRKGYYADLAVIDLNKGFTVSKDILLSKCAWSPYEGQNFSSKIEQTYINGILAYNNGHFNDNINSMRLQFSH